MKIGISMNTLEASHRTDLKYQVSKLSSLLVEEREKHTFLSFLQRHIEELSRRGYTCSSKKKISTAFMSLNRDYFQQKGNANKSSRKHA